MRATWQARLWAKAAPDANGCWIWQGAVDSSGYGVFRGPVRDARGAVSTAHRWAYVATNGAAPADLVIDHLCNVRTCVNPSHLEAVTNAENQRRRAERQTHCLRGHEFTPENTRHNPRGSRTCRACGREYDRARRAA